VKGRYRLLIRDRVALEAERNLIEPPDPIIQDPFAALFLDPARDERRLALANFVPVALAAIGNLDDVAHHLRKRMRDVGRRRRIRAV
jgi:hypothetical protein